MSEQETVIKGSEARKQSTLFEVGEKVRCLTFELEESFVLVSNTVVAEVTAVVDIEEMTNTPDWFAGMMTWRELTIPVIVLEKILDEQAGIPASYKKIIILNTLNDLHGERFYALGCQSIPSLTMIDASRLDLSESTNEAATHVVLEGQDAVIPDMNILEKKILSVFEQ